MKYRATLHTSGGGCYVRQAATLADLQAQCRNLVATTSITTIDLYKFDGCLVVEQRLGVPVGATS